MSDKSDHESDSTNSDMSEDTKLERLRKKPEKLRKQLFEVVLRKRIFLTDRMEKIEKMLCHFKLVEDSRMASQQSELLDKASEDQFGEYLKHKLYEESSLDGGEGLLAEIKKVLVEASCDDVWYELYKSVTSEKDLAERDQQKLVRRERRKLKKRKILREDRMRRLAESLKIRAEYRRREGLRMRSTSVDSYHNYTDKE